MFTAMDTDNSGAITFDELKAGLRRYGSTMKDTEIRDLMEAVSCFYHIFCLYMHITKSIGKAERIIPILYFIKPIVIHDREIMFSGLVS